MGQNLFSSIGNAVKKLKFVIKTDIMAKLEDFQKQYDLMTAAIAKLGSITGELNALKQKMADTAASGMSPEEQDTALSTLTNIVSALENLVPADTAVVADTPVATETPTEPA